MKPECAGFVLRAFISIIESSIFSAIRSSLLRKNGIPQLLEETVFREEPLYYPNTDKTVLPAILVFLKMLTVPKQRLPPLPLLVYLQAAVTMASDHLLWNYTLRM